MVSTVKCGDPSTQQSLCIAAVNILVGPSPSQATQWGRTRGLAELLLLLEQ